MGSTFRSLYYHIVFSTKERQPLIRQVWRPRLHEYLGGTVRGLDGVPEAIGGVEDLVHLLTSLKSTHELASFVREIKKASSVWFRENHKAEFAWQEGYSVFSVSWTHLPVLRRYISHQEEHHQKIPFRDELVRLLKRNGVEFDRQYIG